MAAESCREHPGSVAIIGLAGRFPGAADLEQFWRNLRQGVETVAPAVGSGAEAEGGVAGIDRFDAGFFAIPPREAELLDPQQRIFLECAWEALEDAGYDPQRFDGAIGVYAGAASYDYAVHNLYPNAEVMRSAGIFQVMLANQCDYLPTRVSYKLDLKGPSVNVQTACSTSLVAVHTACEALLNGECDMALAGGVTVRLPHPYGYRYEEGGILSLDGHCRAFDAEARGTVFSNGAGVVALKRLSQALADGDAVRAVIRGSAINNDGAAKVGYTAPSVAGQAEVIAAALAVAAVEPEEVSYVEAHGTGTPLGDPIEVEALTQAFRAGTARRGFCALGSVKTNVGHLEAAAGICSMIKTVLALEHGELPPSLHYSRPNPKIDFASSPFFVNARLRPWPAGPSPRRAGVSSFGIGGTNAHAVLEEAPPQEPGGPAPRWQLLVLSARTPDALATLAQRLAARLAAAPELPLAEVAYTLQVGRRAFDHRLAVVCRQRDEAARRLAAGTEVWRGTAAERRVTWWFGELSPELLAALTVLAREVPALRAAVEGLAAELGGDAAGELRAVLAAPGGEAAEVPAGRRAAAAAFALQLALARMLRLWGVEAGAAAGGGRGELAAAVEAGVLTVRESWRLAAGGGGGEPVPRAPRLPFFSAALGRWSEGSAPPAGWLGRLGADAASPPAGDAKPGRPLLAVGPLPAGLPAAAGGEVIGALGAGGEGSALAALLTAVGRLWIAGFDIDWPALHRGESRRRVPLPTYPFERRRFWIAAATGPDLGLAAADERGAVPASPDDRRRHLAAIFEEVLGVAEVGAEESFSALDGDSVAALQVASRAHEVGLEVSAELILERQTIAGILAALDAARRSPPAAPASAAAGIDGDREALERLLAKRLGRRRDGVPAGDGDGR